MTTTEITDTQLLKEGFIIEKAYEIPLDKLDEGYLSDNIICYAENTNKAKVELLEQIRWDGCKLKYSGEELNYLNIPVQRRKASDKVIFEGKAVTRCQIDDIIKERERLAKLEDIQNNPNITHCYIVKGSYYRPNNCGYTSYKHEAGVYEKEDAIQHAKFCRDIRLESCYIDEHNRMVNDKIAELSSRLIKRI